MTSDLSMHEPALLVLPTRLSGRLCIAQGKPPEHADGRERMGEKGRVEPGESLSAAVSAATLRIRGRGQNIPRI